MKDNMVTVMLLTGILLSVDVIVGGKVLFRTKEFLFKVLIAASIFVVATLARDKEFAELLCGDLWPFTVTIAVVVTIIVVGDLIRYSTQLERHHRRRHHGHKSTHRKHSSNRTAPAKH